MSFDMMKQDPSMVTGEEDENFEEWQVIPAVQIGMTQHEPIFKCTKRAVEKILF